mmetsp:Transcript_14133/g.19618  ORF Transcript_14133/g.19618 Transcript_14133/m.19618 type:complete len:529 (+) Transcript_14133:401-1987(+)
MYMCTHAYICTICRMYVYTSFMCVHKNLILIRFSTIVLSSYSYNSAEDFQGEQLDLVGEWLGVGKSRLRSLLNHHAVSKFTKDWLSLHPAGNEEEFKTASLLVDAIVSGQIEEEEKLSDTEIRKFSLPEGVSWLGLSDGESMYVRPGWPELADCIISRIQEKKHGGGVGKTPGIGKTVFLNYLLLRFYRKFPNRKILLYSAQEDVFYALDWINKQVRISKNNPYTSLPRDAWLFLDDPAKAAPWTDHYPIRGRAPYSCVSSGRFLDDRSNRLSEMFKQLNVPTFIMDPPSKKQHYAILSDMFQGKMNPDDLDGKIKEAYYMWGGSLRIGALEILHDKKALKSHREFLEKRLSQFDSAKSLPAMVKKCTTTGRDTSHYIIHEFNKPFLEENKSSVDERLASDYVSKMLREYLKKKSYSELAQFVNELSHNAPGYGIFFEDYIHGFFKEDTERKIVIRPLADAQSEEKVLEKLHDASFTAEHLSKCFKKYPFAYVGSKRLEYKRNVLSAEESCKKWNIASKEEGLESDSS